MESNNCCSRNTKPERRASAWNRHNLKIQRATEFDKPRYSGITTENSQDTELIVAALSGPELSSAWTIFAPQQTFAEQ